MFGCLCFRTNYFNTVKSRDAAVIVDKSRDAYPVTTLEFDSKPFVDALASGAEFWPSSLPHIDGVVLCYDASRRGNEQGSFDHILPLNGKPGTLLDLVEQFTKILYRRRVRSIAIPHNLGCVQERLGSTA